MQKRFRKRAVGSAVVLSAALVLGTLAVQPTESSAATKAKKLKVTPASKTLYIGGPSSKKTVTLKVKVTPTKASKKVTYKSSNKKVATVSAKGKVTAKKTGKTTITVTSKSNKKLKAKIKIKVKKYQKTTNDTSNQTSESTVSPTATATSTPTVTSTPTATATVAPTSAPTTTATVAPTSAATATPPLTSTSEPDVAADSVQFSKSTVKVTKTGTKPNPTTTLSLTMSPANATSKVTYSSSDTDVATVNEDGKVTGIATGTAEITATTDNGKTAACTVTVAKSTVAIHDPSIFKDPISGKYYTIGTGVAMAVSEDLQAWSSTTQGVNLFKNGIDEFEELFAYTGASKDIGNVWAADLIYNTKMEKYCMYVCATCDESHKYKTAIAMFSADSPTGPYSYQGLIVCADFTKDNIETTNIRSALNLSEEDEIPAYYYDANESGTGDSAYYKENFPDCIDPAPYYGPDGTLYMAYGSFTCSGGIHVLKLDPETGLRSSEYNYPYEEGVSTPYFGKKITNKAGEGPYIQQVKTSKSSTGYYYYLWTSSGLLRGTGNYHMSMFRSENPDGPFVDVSGKEATSGGGALVTYNYKYSFMKMAYTSMGGNSAFVDDDGKMYLVYHNKFSDDSKDPGTHMLKFHQMFMNEDGWLVTSPFEYHGEKIADSYEKDSVAGDYEFVIHNMSTAETVGNYNYNSSKALKLGADGKVTGSLEGTWSLSGNNITMTIGTTVYKGVVLEQYEDDGNVGNAITSNDKTMVFTLCSGSGVMVWGSKVTATDKEAVAFDADQLSVDETLENGFDAPAYGLYGSTIEWESDNAAVSISNGKAVLTRGASDVAVTITAKVSKGSETETKKFNTVVKALNIVISKVVNDDHIVLPSELAGNTVTWTSSDPAVIDASTGSVTQDSSESKTVTLTAKVADMVVKIPIVVLPTAKNVIYSQDFSKVTKAADVMTSTNYQDGVTLEQVDDFGQFLQFASAQENSRGAVMGFGVSESVGTTYTVEFDLSLKAGNDQTTEFVLTGNDKVYSGKTVNDGISDGYIIKLSSDKSTTWSINGEDEVVLPTEWVHVKAVVDTENSLVTVKISDDTTTYYDGVVSVHGTGKLDGFYIRGGRYQSVTKMDNIEVY